MMVGDAVLVPGTSVRVAPEGDGWWVLAQSIEATFSRGSRELAVRLAQDFEDAERRWGL